MDTKIKQIKGSDLDTTWIVMPAYNEATRIAKTIADVKTITKNIIVIDDGSKDNTKEVAKKNTTHVIHHSINLGKGAALKTGTDYAISLGAKYVVFIDSDGQHQAKHIPKMVSLLHKYDLVFGSRQFDKNMPLIPKIGNIGLSTVIKILFNVSIHDSQSGYRAMTIEAYKKIKWIATDYSVETEMIANVGKHKLSYTEIWISTIYNDRYKGTTPLDGIKIMMNMIGYKLKGL